MSEDLLHGTSFGMELGKAKNFNTKIESKEGSIFGGEISAINIHKTQSKNMQKTEWF